MSNLSVGDVVICVDAKPLDGRPMYGLRKGGVYTVSAVQFSGDGVTLAELNCDPWPGFLARRFRKLDSRRLDVFRRATSFIPA